MQLTPDIIVPAITQLGIGGIFLYLFIKKDKQLEEVSSQKDRQLQENNSQVLEAFRKNTETMSNIKNAVDNNTEATKMLSTRIYDIVVNKEKK